MRDPVKGPLHVSLPSSHRMPKGHLEGDNQLASKKSFPIYF